MPESFQQLLFAMVDYVNTGEEAGLRADIKGILSETDTEGRRDTLEARLEVIERLLTVILQNTLR